MTDTLTECHHTNMSDAENELWRFFTSPEHEHSAKKNRYWRWMWCDAILYVIQCVLCIQHGAWTCSDLYQYLLSCLALGFPSRSCAKERWIFPSNDFMNGISCYSDMTCSRVGILRFIAGFIMRAIVSKQRIMSRGYTLLAHIFSFSLWIQNSTAGIWKQNIAMCLFATQLKCVRSK